MVVGSKKHKICRNIFITLGVIIVLIPPLFVFWWMFTSALKTPVDILSPVPKLIFTPTWDNFKEVLQQENFLRYMWNSLVIATFATAIALVLGLPAAYSIAKYRQQKLALGILVARMIPFVSYLLPWFIFFRKLNLIDTYLALITTHLIITLPMTIWLMIGYFEDVPDDLEEAAMVDGCSRVRSFLTITLPLVRNGVVASAILSFIFSWNQFLFSLILSGPRTKTVPVAVFNFISFEQINWGGLSAAATLIVLPALILTLIIQKQIVRGLTMGAVKG
ncbi:MAG: carbohydrate ABC transporter permease [Firmicutes bacterium]|nr:carbohydrate ABC transporter permease [Bacillota bacterium]